jgi:hypothetical protein
MRGRLGRRMLGRVVRALERSARSYPAGEFAAYVAELQVVAPGDVRNTTECSVTVDTH